MKALETIIEGVRRRETIEINAIENFFDRLIDWNLLNLTNKND